MKKMTAFLKTIRKNPSSNAPSIAGAGHILPSWVKFLVHRALTLYGQFWITWRGSPLELG